MTISRILSLFQILLLVFAWQCYDKVAAIITDDIANLNNEIISTINQQLIPSPTATPGPLGMETLPDLDDTLNGSNSTNNDLNENGESVFDVTKHGAKADGKTDDAQVRNNHTQLQSFNLS